MAEEKPSIPNRIKLALRVFRDGLPSSSWGRQRKSSPFLWPAWREGKPEWQIGDFESYVSEGFDLNSLIYSAVLYKARVSQLAPLRAYAGELDHPEVLAPNHDLARLTARPNPYQSGLAFQAQQRVYLNVAGNSYVHLDRPKRGALPTAMRSLRPDRVHIIPAQGGLKGFVYVPEGKTAYEAARDGSIVPMLAEDVIHVKLPWPGDPLEGLGYGLSPISPLARSGDVDNKVTEFLKLFFDSGTMLSTYLKFDVPMDEGEIARARSRWKEIYGGYTNWTEVGILDQGGTVERFGMTFQEMGFAELDERNESRILGPFGVPPILLGTRVGLNRSTYSNAEESRRMFWQDTQVPETQLYEAEYQYRLVTNDGWVAFDYTRVPALQKDVPKLAEAAHKLWQMGVPANAAIAAVGLDVESVKGGDIGYLPIGVLPVGSPRPAPAPAVPGAGRPAPDAEGGKEPEGEESGDEPGGEEAANAGEETRKSAARPSSLSRKSGLSAEAKALIWKAFDLTATAWEPAFETAAVNMFDADKRDLLALLAERGEKALGRKEMLNWETFRVDVGAYLREHADGRWRETFVPLVQGVMSAQAANWQAQLGVRFDVANLYAAEWFTEYQLQFAKPILATTSDDISELLLRAQTQGWGVAKVKNALEALFSRYLGAELTEEQRSWFGERMPAYRRELIARVETMRAANTGTHRLLEAWGAPMKEWIHTPDNRVRDSHRTAGNSYQEGGEPGPIAFGQPFQVNGHPMMHPHDMTLGAPLEEVAGCRCTEAPFFPEGWEMPVEEAA
jgi:HK97 family phage portal protein